MIATALSRAAAGLFTARQARAAEIVRNRGMSLHQAEAHLRPWLAIACLCGADLPELAEPLAERVTKRTDGSFDISEGEARGLVALDICPRKVWAPLLEKARDTALDALPAHPEPVEGPAHPEPVEGPQLEAARALRDLANHLGCKPWLPGCTASQRNAA